MVLPLSGILVDKIKLVQEPFYTLCQNINDRELLDTLRAWEAMAMNEADSPVPDSPLDPLVILPRGDALYEAFGRLLIGDFVRNSEDWVTSRATAEDSRHVLDFVKTGQHPPDRVRETIWRQMKDTAFFVTEGGAMGLGYRDSKPRDEVWIFNGGRVPFTVRPIGDGNGVDYNFVGRCYVQGIMFGEMFADKSRVPPKRDIRLH